MKIRITIGSLSMDAELFSTPTTEKLMNALPIKASFDTWGDEIYFTIPVESELDNTAREEVEVGDIGYWPTGNAFCIFFGPTPMSTGLKPVPASAVNVIGKVLGDPTLFRPVTKVKEVTLEIL